MKKKFYKELAVIILAFSLSIKLSAQVLNVPQINQEHSNWCWDASSKCILDYYGHVETQCAIANYAWNRSDCCGDTSFNWEHACNSTNILYPLGGSVQDVLAHFGNIQSTGWYIYTPSLSDIQTEISNQRPFIFAWQWSAGGGHALVCHGIIGTDIAIMDPWYGEASNIWDYNWAIDGTGSEGTHTWERTLTMDISPFYSCTDNFEPNNNGSTATIVFASPLTGSANYTLQGTNIGFYDDQDWYKIDLNTQGNLQINLSNLPYNYDLFLYPDATGSTFLSYSNKTLDSNEVINYHNSSTGLVHLYVKILAAYPTDYWTSSCYNIQFIFTPSSSCSLTGITPSCIYPGSGTSPGTTITTTTPTITWNAVTGATNYGVYIRDMVSNTLVVNNNCASTATSYTVQSGILSDGGKYRWNIIATDGCGNACESNYAEPKYFQVQTTSSCTLTGITPTLVSPGNSTSPGQSITTTTPTLIWNKVSGATSYGVYVRDLVSNILVISNDCVGSDTTFTIPSSILNNQGQYRWNIIAKASCGSTCASYYSNKFYFQIQTSGSLPDLVINNQSLSSSTVSQGGSITAYCGESNIGIATASTNSVSLYLSTDAVLTPSTNGDTYLGFITIPSIDADSSSIINSKTIQIPNGTASGNYYICFWADGGQIVSESNENNNVAFKQISITNFIQYSDGTLDTSFNHIGKVTTSIGSGDAMSFSVALQSDEKIIVAGTSNDEFAVARYNINGTLDSTFSFDGIVSTLIGNTGNSTWNQSVAIQSDGKIIVVGQIYPFDFAVIRYNTDGTLDNTFSSDGKIITPVGSFIDESCAVAVQSDGKIIVGGSSYINLSNSSFALVRYNTNGALDNTFGNNGKIITSLGNGIAKGNSVAIQPDGKIVVAGHSDNGSNYDFAVVRYNTNGTLDNYFGSNGKITTSIGNGNDEGHSVVIQFDGKFIVAGSTYNSSSQGNDFAIVRYNTNGTVDSSFSFDGIVITPTFVGASSVAIQEDGKYVVAGGYSLIRYNLDGTLDSTFSNDGIINPVFGGVNSDISVAIQSDGKIIAVGTSVNVYDKFIFAINRYSFKQITTLITNVSNVSCNGGYNGSATVAVTNGTAPYTFLWSTTPPQTTATATGLSAGNYTVTITGANGATATSNVTITQPWSIYANILSFTNVSCNGDSNGTVTISAFGGNPPYTYSWNTNPTQCTSIATGLFSGNYTATVSDENGCQSTTSVTIDQPLEILIDISSKTDVSCFGINNGAINITVTGGVAPCNYSWSNGDTTQNISGLTYGNYIVTVTDNNNCSKISTCTITQPASISISNNVTNASCGNNNGSIDISVSGGSSPYTYYWSNATTTQNINNLEVGSYKVTITDFNGCQSISSFISVSEITLPLITLQPQPFNDTLCIGQNVSFKIKATGDSLNYQWLKNGINLQGATDSTFSINLVTFSDSGNYSCNISNTCGSVTSNYVYLYVSPNSLPSIVSHPVNQNACIADSVSFNIVAIGGFLNYQWSKNNVNINDANNLSYSISSVSQADNGNYSCFISNNCGSITSDYATLTVSSKPQTSNISGFTNVTVNQTPTYTVTNHSGSTYNWIVTGGTQLSGGNTSSAYIKWTNPGIGKVQVIETNNGWRYC